MKIVAIIFLLSFSFILPLNAQVNKSQETIDAEIKASATTFLDCLIKKDSVKFFNLFNENPITFVRMVAPDKKQIQNNQDYTIENDYFNDDYKVFYRNFSSQGYTDVKHDSLAIEQIDYTASIIFNYAFLKAGKEKCHGNLSIGLIYKNTSWLITRVIYNKEEESQ